MDYLFLALRCSSRKQRNNYLKPRQLFRWLASRSLTLKPAILSNRSCHSGKIRQGWHRATVRSKLLNYSMKIIITTTTTAAVAAPATTTTTTTTPTTTKITPAHVRYGYQAPVAVAKLLYTDDGFFQFQLLLRSDFQFAFLNWFFILFNLGATTMIGVHHNIYISLWTSCIGYWIYEKEDVSCLYHAI